MASFNGPKLTNPIRTDVPDTQEVLVALAKQDPTSISDIPSGAKRLYEASSGKWQWQLYNGTSWAPVPFLQHNVDQLDGYHAAITPAANTVAVRNASGLLEDSIAGNAATASSAATLSGTLPVNKGGTGATTSEAARSNLGVPPTSHASSGTTYGLGSNLNYGHVRGDGETADVIAGEIVVKDVLYNNRVSLTKSGLFGVVKYIGGSYKFDIDTEDFDILLLNTSSNTGTNPPGFNGFFLIRQYFYSRTTDLSVCSRKQIAYGFFSNEIFTRHFRSGAGWHPWVKVVNETDLATSSAPGIVKPGTGMTVDAAGALNVNTASTSKAGIVQLNNTVTSTSESVAATANAVKMAYDKAVEAEAVLPAGFVIAFAANSAPSGYLLCNGAAVSRTTYKRLFDAISTTYGAGDERTTFNLPYLTDRFIQGSDTAGTVKSAGLPEISGQQRLAVAGEGSRGTGAFSASYEKGSVGGYTNSNLAYYTKGIGILSTIIKASNVSSIYGASTTVQPPAVTMRYYIKY